LARVGVRDGVAQIRTPFVAVEGTRIVAPLPPKSQQGLSAQQSTGSGPHFDVTSFPASKFTPLKLVRPRGTGYAVPEISRAILIRLIDFPETPFRSSLRETIKSGRTALVVRTEMPIGGKMVSVAYKRIRRRNWIKRLTLLFRTNRALRSWHMAHKFLELGIATAKPLAVIVPRGSAISGDSYLATEWLTNAGHPADFARMLRPFEPRARSQRTRIAARKLGDLLGRMHACRIAHRDLKPSNIYLQDQGDDVAAYVIDLDGAALRPRIGRPTRIRDLSRLALGFERSPDVSLADRLRFLHSYLAAAGASDWTWKSAWRDLHTATELRRARKLNKRKH